MKKRGSKVNKKKKKIVGMEENGKKMSQKQFEKKDIRAKNGIKRGR